MDVFWDFVCAAAPICIKLMPSFFCKLGISFIYITIIEIVF